MANLSYRPDVRWNKPVVMMPGSEKWMLIERHFVATGLVAELGGQQMLFLDTANHWISLVSRTAALRVCQVIGNDNVSVNYTDSYAPYYSKFSKACGINSFSFVPVSTCIGTERLTVELDRGDRTLRFDLAEPYPIRGDRRIPSFVYSLCYQPTDHVNIPMSYTFPGVGTIVEFLRPLFPDVRTMISYMWLVGNCARDPIARARCMLLCGPGGSGKSTALRMATSAMQGVTNLIPDNILTRNFNGLEDKIAQTVVKSRLVTCYELDLDRCEVNMSMFKNITGSDYVKVGEFMSKAVCSFAIATNGLPDVDRQPDFTSDALSRRMVCLKMNVDTAEAPFEPDPGSGVDKMDFHCACLYTRMHYSDLPISPDDLLLSLCMSKYHCALELIDVGTRGPVSAIEGRAVVAVISGLMRSEPYRIIERCRLMSMSCLSATPLGPVLKGMKCRSVTS